MHTYDITHLPAVQAFIQLHPKQQQAWLDRLRQHYKVYISERDLRQYVQGDGWTLVIGRDMDLRLHFSVQLEYREAMEGIKIALGRASDIST